MRRIETCVALLISLAGCQAVVGGVDPTDAPARRSERTTSTTAGSADTELRFIRANYRRYVNGESTFGGYYRYALANATLGTAYYRASCSMALASLLDRRASGRAVDPRARDFQILSWNLNHKRANGHTEFWNWRQPDNSDFWLAPMTGLQCLLAVNLARSGFDSASTNDLYWTRTSWLYDNFAQLADDVYRRFDLAYFRCKQDPRSSCRGNRGDSTAEEVGFTAAFLVAAAKLVLSQRIVDAARRQRFVSRRGAYLARAGKLVAYSYSQCSSDCPLEPDSYLVTNHQLEPHPAYTLSLLTSYAEIAAIYRQLGEGLPSWFPPRSAFEAIGRELRARVDDRYRFRKKAKFVDRFGNAIFEAGATDPAGLDYAKATYTIRNEDGTVFRRAHGVVDWGFDAALQNSAYAILARQAPAYAGDYAALVAEQSRRGLETRPYFPPRLRSGVFSYGNLVAAQAAAILVPLMDGLATLAPEHPDVQVDRSSLTRGEQINSHWFLNTLAAYNHSVAYLLTTSQRLLGAR